MENPRVRPLTSSTRVALAIARGIAAARGDRNLTPTHIALGIFREGSNPGLAALWYAGLSEEEIRRIPFELEHSLGKAPGHIPPRLVTIDLTPGEENLLRASEVEAEHFGHPYLGTEHIVLAILRSDSRPAQHITERGVSADKYVAGMLSMLRGDPPPSPATAV